MSRNRIWKTSSQALNRIKNKSKNIVIHLLSATEKTGVKFGFSYPYHPGRLDIPI